MNHFVLKIWYILVFQKNIKSLAKQKRYVNSCKRSEKKSSTKGKIFSYWTQKYFVERNMDLSWTKNDRIKIGSKNDSIIFC